MFDQVVIFLEQYPYVGVAAVFLLCGVGLPLPEEIVLLAGGYVCATWPERATLHWMMVWCAGAILAGDLLPFVLGRVFGARLLRLRWMRILVTKQRLAMFDRWFRRRGDMVILIARFIAGLRVVAFFTAGTMKMPWRRFLLLDGLGIALIVPLLTWLGYHSASFIDDMIANVKRVERGILWAIVGGVLVLGLWFWLWRRRRSLRRERRLGETFVQPQRPVHPPNGLPATPEGPSETAPEQAPEPAPEVRADGPADDPTSPRPEQPLPPPPSA